MTEMPRATPRSTTSPARLPALTGMRFIAAAMVFFYHSLWEGFFASPKSADTAHSLFYQGGWTGVGFFFLLSGFILTWSARPDDTAPVFWRRRLFKIYPLHLVTLVIALALASWVSQAAFSGWDAALNALLLQAWSPDIMVRGGFNGVAWSLSCEALFYALFPLLYWAIRRIRPERLWLWAGVVAAAVFAVPLVSALLPDQTPVPPVNVTAADLWFVYQFPGTRLLDFVFGIVLGRIVLERRRLPLSFGGSLALAIAAYAVAPMLPASYHMVALMLVPLGLVVASCAAQERDGVRSVLSNRAWVWLGEVSFAFYMTHLLVLMYGHKLLGTGKSWDTPAAIGVLALLFAATLAVSWLLFTLVERPLMRRFATSRKRRGTTRRSVVEVPAPKAETRAPERESSLL